MEGIKEFRILHFSDLHFSEEDAGEFSAGSAIKNLTTYLEKESLPIDVVVVTGDIVDKCSKGGTQKFQKALGSFKCLQERLVLESERFFFVPGNHDVDCTTNERGKHPERFRNYVRFVNEFLGKNPELGKIEWYQSTEGADELNTAIHLPLPQLSVDFLLMNSVWNYNYKDKPKDISIQDAEIDYFKKKGIDLRKRNSLKIALVHNSSITPIKFSAKAGKSISNSGKLLAGLSKCGVSFLLHGDYHASQHAAAARSLESWPLYILGAGRTSRSGRGVPHFHILNVRCCHESNCAEIEVFSYLVNSETPSLLGGKCYDLYGTLQEKSESKASIHRFELSEPDRPGCINRPIKDLLFAFRSNTFSFLREGSRKLLRGEDLSFYPDQMFSLFYDSIFDIGGKGDFFRAVHRYDWTIWLSDTSSFNTLGKHKKAAEKGLNIERIIILPKDEVDKIRSDGERRELLKDLCKHVKDLTVDEGENKHFVTFLVKEESLPDFDSFDKESKIPDLQNISIGDISLFTKGGEPFEGVNENNSIAFFFNEEHKPNTKIWIAHLNRTQHIIEFIKQCMSILWKDRSRLIDSRELIGPGKLERFLG